MQIKFVGEKLKQDLLAPWVQKMGTFSAEALAGLGAENPSEVLGSFFDMDTESLEGGLYGMATMGAEGVRIAAALSSLCPDSLFRIAPR